MRHSVLDRWSRGESAIHRLDARAKIIPLFAFLIALGTASSGLPWLGLALFLALIAALLWARVPVLAMLARAAMVLPLAAVFAAVSWAGGEPARGAVLAVRSYLSALAVLFVAATTPFPDLLRGLERLRVPGFLLNVTHFLYRYLFVIAEEARQMSRAAAARGGSASGWLIRERFRAAAGALVVLFARSYARAEEIHRAMLARGFAGYMPAVEGSRLRAADALFAGFACILPWALRTLAERISP